MIQLHTKDCGTGADIQINWGLIENAVLIHLPDSRPYCRPASCPFTYHLGHLMRIRARKRGYAPVRTDQPVPASQSGFDGYSMLSITDCRGKILYVNDTYCSVSGFDREELIGRTHQVVRSGTLGREFYQQLWDTIRKEQTWRGMITNRTKSGQLFWVHTIIVPVRDRSDSQLQFLCFQHDVSPDIRDEFRKLVQERQKDLERLLGSVIHEIGNPLTTVKGFLQQYNSTVAFSRNEVGLLLTELGQIERTLQGLNELARNFQSRSFSRFNLARVLGDVVSQLQRDGQEDTIRIAYCNKEDLSIRGDQSQIERVFRWLIDEALQWAPGEGGVEISLSLEAGILVRISQTSVSRKRQAWQNEEEWEESEANWRRIIRDQIFELHQAEYRINLLEGFQAEVRFPRYAPY